MATTTLSTIARIPRMTVNGARTIGRGVAAGARTIGRSLFSGTSIVGTIIQQSAVHIARVAWSGMRASGDAIQSTARAHYHQFGRHLLPIERNPPKLSDIGWMGTAFQ